MSLLPRRHLLHTAGAVLAAGAVGAVTAGPAAAAPSAPGETVLDFTYSAQPTAYWCGPCTTSMVISAKAAPPALKDLVQMLGTTTSGTKLDAMVPALTDRIPRTYYTAHHIDAAGPTGWDHLVFYSRVSAKIAKGFATSLNWRVPPGQYPSGYQNRSTLLHHVAVVGFNDKQELLIADPARFEGKETYWVPARRALELCAQRGYTW